MRVALSTYRPCELRESGAGFIAQLLGAVVRICAPPGCAEYLLSGLLRCEGCGGSMIVTAFRRGGKRLCRYTCSRNNKRGPTACANNIRPLMEELDGLVLGELSERILTPEGVEHLLKAAEARAVQKQQENPEALNEIKRDIGKLQEELARFMDLIAEGKAPKAVLERITALEHRIEAKEKLLAELRIPKVTQLADYSLRR